MSVAIDISHGLKKYGDTTVIPDLSLTVRNGEFFTLLGPSGCGKTTLLRMIAGFNSIEGGTFKFNDKVINDMEPGKRGIGMVFQNYAIFPNMTVRKNVEFGLKYKNIPKNQIREEADRFLSLGFKLGIGGSLTRSPDGRLEDMVRRAPAEAVLLETDAPWVRPSFEGGEPEDGENDPAVTIPHILGLVSRIRGTDQEEMAEIIEENADSLFPRMKKTDTDGSEG